MNQKNLLLQSLEYIFNQPKTYEILLATSLVVFIMTILSALYTFNQPPTPAVYYNINSTGHLQPAQTIPSTAWSNQDKAVLGEQIER